MIVSVLKGVISQELNNFEGDVNLIADVAVPTKKFEASQAVKLSEQETEELFDHKTNYITVLNKTLNSLKQKHSVNSELLQKNTTISKKDIKLPLIIPSIPSKVKHSSREAAG